MTIANVSNFVCEPFCVVASQAQHLRSLRLGYLPFKGGKWGEGWEGMREGGWDIVGRGGGWDRERWDTCDWKCEYPIAMHNIIGLLIMSTQNPVNYFLGIELSHS